tara:strand:+ start:683 stop:1066 length:384 start_codon:yes stop_codon:yes gene_type:complete
MSIKRPLGDDYVLYCVWHPSRQKELPKKPKQPKEVRTAMNKVKPYMTDEEVNRHLSQYSESGFEDLPDWLRSEIRARSLVYEKREPSELEQWETNHDAREHRITNKELTFNDYKDKYLNGKSLTLIT